MTKDLLIVEHDDYIWSPVELCSWCGFELPPIYDNEDIFECHCGETRTIPSWLTERMEHEAYGQADRDSAGRLDWGPPGRYRPFPARSGYPYNFVYPHND